MTVWITGANGFIARHLARELADHDIVVDGIGYGAPEEIEREKWGYRTCLNAELSSSGLNELAARVGLPSAIYHLAGGSSVSVSLARPHEDFSRTVTSTEHLLEWMRCNAPQCRIIATSSAAVYGSQYSGPIVETSDLNPMSPYGRHKQMMEQICCSYAEKHAAQAIVVRLFSVYGATLRKQLLWDLCRRLESGDRRLTLGGTGVELRDWTHVRDVARLLATLMAQDFKQPYTVLNGGSGVGTSVVDVAKLVVDNWGTGAGVTFSGVGREGDPTNLISDSSGVESLGFEWKIGLQAGVREYVEWFRSKVD